MPDYALIDSRYAAVIVRAGGACQCRLDAPGGCGTSRNHPGRDSTCRHRPDGARPEALLAAPADPDTALAVAAGLDADSLIALCQPCYATRATAAAQRAAARRAEQLATAQIALFDLTPPERGSTEDRTMTNTAVNGHQSVDFNKSVVSMTKTLSPEQITHLQQRMADRAAEAGHVGTVGTLRLDPVDPQGSADGWEDEDGVYAPAIPAQAEPDEALPWRRQPLVEPRPEAFLSWEHLRLAAAETAAVARNKAAFHLWRLPKYTWRFAALAAVGGWAYGHRAWHYLQAGEYGEAIDQALRARVDGETIAEMRQEHKDLKKERWSEPRTFAGLGTVGGYVVATVYVAVVYGLVAASPAGLIALGVLHLLGRMEHRRHHPDEPLQIVAAYQAPEVTDPTVLTAERINEALRAADILKPDEVVELVGLVTRDATGAAEAVFDLPRTASKTAKEAAGAARVERVAQFLRVDSSWIDLTPGTHAGRLSLWVPRSDPFEQVRKSPLLTQSGPIDAWNEGIPIAYDKRGRIIYVRIRDMMFVIGGATRAGKGVALSNVICGSALAPYINIRTIDGKGAAEHLRYAPVCASMFRFNPERLLLLLQAEIRQMQIRAEQLADLGKSKLTADLLEQMPIELMIVDELIPYTGGNVPTELRREIVACAETISSMGAGLGFLLGLATQNPKGGIIAPEVRGNLGNKWAMRTDSSAQSNAILGDGMAGDGYNANEISKDHRGLGWLSMEGVGTIQARSLFIDEDAGEIDLLINKGRDIRSAVGRLPGQFEDPIEAELIRLTGRTSVAGGPAGRGAPGAPSFGARGILGQIRRAFQSADDPAFLPTVHLIELLAAQDPAGGWAQREGESERAWSSRAGAALSKEIAKALEGTGRTLERTKDGGATRGLALADLRAAIGA
ncbi:hypothetical protein ACFZDG_35650 [Kitasatospora xanthocidica]|uniref:hypothetical protein n=1 Tax=Kitasatospora xanthocidica TaxID=83382 RepID=UPI0036E707BE